MKPTIQINDLIDQHGDSFVECSGCELCGKIEQLRADIDIEPNKKFRHILAKGQDMKKEDIVFLLESGIVKKEIWKALKINYYTFEELLKDWNIEVEKEIEEIKADVAARKRNKFSEEDYRRLESAGMIDAEIAREFGVHPATIVYNKKRWAKQIG